MTVMAIVLGLTDLTLLAVIICYGKRIKELESIDNHKKWKNQYNWNEYVSKKLDMLFRNLGIWPYDGSYKHNEALNYVEELNPTKRPVNIDVDVDEKALE